MVLTGTEIVSGNGLHALIETHHNHDKQEYDTVYNTESANGKVTIIFFQSFVDKDDNEAGCQIHQKRRHTDGNGVFYDAAAQFVNTVAQMEQFVFVGEGFELPCQ